MVGDDHDQAVVEGPEGLQPVEDPSEHAVGVADLSQVLALGVRGRDAIGGARTVRGPQRRDGVVPVPAAGRQVLPRRMGDRRGARSSTAARLNGRRRRRSGRPRPRRQSPAAAAGRPCAGAQMSQRPGGGSHSQPARRAARRARLGKDRERANADRQQSPQAEARVAARLARGQTAPRAEVDPEAGDVEFGSARPGAGTGCRDARPRGAPARPRGRRPVRIAGTASTEKSASVFVSRYQVAVSARRAKLGYSRRSRRCRASRSETSGSSSKTTITTGAPVDAPFTGSGPGPGEDDRAHGGDDEEQQQDDDRGGAEEAEPGPRRARTPIEPDRDRRPRRHAAAVAGRSADDVVEQAVVREERGEAADADQVEAGLKPSRDQPREELREDERGRRAPARR